MRNKITESLGNLHLGVIQKTVDQVVQSILVNDLQQINESINSQFMQKFNSLLGNLLTNVDEIMNVGKILDAFEIPGWHTSFNGRQFNITIHQNL